MFSCVVKVIVLVSPVQNAVVFQTPWLQLSYIIECSLHSKEVEIDRKDG